MKDAALFGKVCVSMTNPGFSQVYKLTCCTGEFLSHLRMMNVGLFPVLPYFVLSLED